ncbi:MAG TPA: lipopolysaccharide biosynthesis protein [Solirubrobacteraceae bacterium]|nr:lipopolysaccharide biosynthesis protein [Solirubrobacteraceae bacterium]
MSPPNPAAPPPRADSASQPEPSSRRVTWRERQGVWRPGSVPVNTIVAGTRTLVRALVSFALLPVLVDRIGAAPSGLFIFATTVTGYFTAVEYGLATSVTKYVAEHRATGDAEQLGSVVRASFILLAGLGLLIGTALALLGVVGGPALFGGAAIHGEVTPTLLVAGATAVFYWPSRIGTAALEGLERYDLSAIIQMVSSVATFALIYVGTELTHSVATLTALFGATLVLEGVAAGVLAWPALGLRRGLGQWRGAHLRPVLGFGGGLFLIGLSDTFVYSLDRTIVAAFVGAAGIVVYEVALRPHNGVRLISGLIGAALVSTSSRLVAQQRGGWLRELALVGSLYSIVLTVPLVVLAMLLAHPIVVAWVGPAYGRHAVYVQIFLSYWLIGANTGVLSSAITGTGRIRVFVRITVISSIVTLALSIWLTSAWGTVGVIWGTVIPSWLGLPLWMHFALRHLGIPKARYAREVLVVGYLPSAIWTVPVFLAERVLHPRSLPALAAFCVVALAALWLALAPMLRARWRRMALGEAPGG